MKNAKLTCSLANIQPIFFRAVPALQDHHNLSLSEQLARIRKGNDGLSEHVQLQRTDTFCDTC